MYCHINSSNDLSIVQILMDSKFESELRALDTDDVKQRTSLFSVQGKSAFIGPVSCFLFFCSIRHLCAGKNKPQTPITAILFITWIIYHECKLSAEWMDLIGNPISACRLISWNNILPMDMFRWICTNMSLPSDFFIRVKFSLSYSEIPWLVKLSLTGKRINFPCMVTQCHTLILWGSSSEIQMFFRIIN